MLIPGIAVYAAGNFNVPPELNHGFDAFDGLMEFIAAWGFRAGGLAILIGGFSFGFGYFADNASAKTAGIAGMIGGFIVVAVALGRRFFLNF
ncbi:MAG: hypothetical protein FWC34_00240 [Bacteroidetes bacterium]|nr:hypothetical protein [Bacteroidota bacterium]